MRTVRILAASIVLAATTACGVVAKDREVTRTPTFTKTSVAGSAEPRAEIWRLRSGLNVAALTCRGSGKPPVTGHYSKMLKRHSQLLDQTYRMETRRYGVAGHDRRQTKVYNRYSIQRSPTRFCGVAADVAREASSMSSAQLSAAASELVARLDSGLR